MGIGRYTIPELVADLRRITAEAGDELEILRRVRPLARRAALSRGTWLEDRMYETDAEQGVDVYMLHEEPDHALAVLAVSWLPNRGTPPHDHGTWAAGAGVDGDEKNAFWERVDDRRRTGTRRTRSLFRCTPTASTSTLRGGRSLIRRRRPRLRSS